jgi:hypothetical protein
MPPVVSVALGPQLGRGTVPTQVLDMTCAFNEPVAE